MNNAIEQEILDKGLTAPRITPQDIDNTIARAARVAHEANRAYCQAIGDDSQLPWDDAPQWQRDSAINGVRFHRANPGATPENSHESWLAEKVANGWEYGPVKDAEAKKHPCCVPFDDLPVAQKAKDFIFRAIAHATA